MTIHLHVNRVFVHDMWCGLNIVRSPLGNQWTFDVARVTCEGCKKAISKASPGELEYASTVTMGIMIARVFEPDHARADEPNYWLSRLRDEH